MYWMKAIVNGILLNYLCSMTLNAQKHPPSNSFLIRPTSSDNPRLRMRNACSSNCAIAFHMNKGAWDCGFHRRVVMPFGMTPKTVWEEHPCSMCYSWPLAWVTASTALSDQPGIFKHFKKLPRTLPRTSAMERLRSFRTWWQLMPESMWMM